ncbi:MAG TPA: hypothetical protein VEL11_12580 [Candidatus Bathyarchaeia archaeon]|nr:hypothetical protein [Candidatus Bathyarchaeia archaeon]
MKSNINGRELVNFSVALTFILILSGSTVSTGSTLGQVSQTQPFGQMQHQETPLKLWTVDPPANNSRIPISEGAMNATNIISHPNVTASKAVSTNFNPYTNVNVQKLITNIQGPVQIGFVNSYWTSNTAQNQFVAGTQSGAERLLNSITGSGSLTNEFVTGSPSGVSSDIALQPVVKQEVAPGEGPSLLAVTLANQGFSAITGITSSLELPQGFEPLIATCCSSIPGSNPQTSLSSYDGVVEPGSTFTLYFGVKVLGNAQVAKQYNSALKLGYAKVTELRGKIYRSEIIPVPFSITGRVILDLVSYSPPLSSLSNVSSLANSSLTNSSSPINLYPGFPNLVNLSLRNVGSAIARGVIASIAGLTSATQVAGVTTQVTVATNVSSGIAAQPTSSSTVILGPKVFNIGIVPPGGSKLISLVIYPSIAAAGTVQTLSLTLSFDDAYGNRASTNQLVGLQILPISPQTGLTVTPSSPIPPPSSSPTSPSSSSPSYSTSPSASSRNQILTKISSFVHPSSTTNDIGASNPSSYSPIQITAGKIQNVTFAINNNNARFPPNVSSLQNSITNLGISLVSKSSFISILGPSTWNLPTILPGSAQLLTTQVFAPKSLLDNPVAFTVRIQYSQNGHQVKTASFDLGAIVVGDIQLKVNNLGINYIGNNPVLVGNVVNEGNTPAQFVNVEMLQQGESQSQQASSQYLGNIATNSSKPINIPLQDVPILSGQRQNDIRSDKNEVPLLTRIALNSSAMKSFDTGVENNTTPGIHPVSLKLTYYDDLKNSHDLIINSPVQINAVQPEGTSNQGDGLFAILIAAIIISIGIAVILLRKRPETNGLSFSKIYKLLSRNTTKMESAHPPDEKREGAPFSPI